MKTAHIHYGSEEDWKPSALSLEPQLILCFGDAEFFFASELPKKIAQRCPEAHVIGCSSSSIIANASQDKKRVSINLIQFEESDLHFISRQFTPNTDYRSAGQGLAQAFPHKGLRHILLFSSGIQVDGQALLSGMADFLPDEVLVSGGVAADRNDFMHSWCWHNDLLIGDGCVAIGLYGDVLEIGHGMGSGWDRFGLSREITQSEGNTIHAIDGKPPRDLYEKYLGEYIWELPNSGQLIPLYLYNPKRPSEHYVRTITAINENGGLTFSGSMPQGWHVHLMKSNQESLVEGALIAALLAKEHCQDVYEPELTLVVAGSGRPQVLGPMAEEELEKLADALGGHTAIFGFYGFGEYSPDREGERYSLHNQSIGITTITELI